MKVGWLTTVALHHLYQSSLMPCHASSRGTLTLYLLVVGHTRVSPPSFILDRSSIDSPTMRHVYQSLTWPASSRDTLPLIVIC